MRTHDDILCLPAYYGAKERNLSTDHSFILNQSAIEGRMTNACNTITLLVVFMVVFLKNSLEDSGPVVGKYFLRSPPRTCKAKKWLNHVASHNQESKFLAFRRLLE